MCIGVGLDLVVFQTTDGAVHLQHGQRDLMVVADAVFSQGALEFIHADMFFRHVRLDDAPVVNQQAGLPLDELAKAAVRSRDISDHIVHQEQCASRDHSAHQRRIGPGHRILHRIGKKQQKSEVEGRHLADFTLAAQAHAEQHDKVDDARPQRDLQQGVLQ